MTHNWLYHGDVSLEYGGTFIDLSNWEHGYADAVVVTDLDSGCGFTGASMIEHVVICGLDDPKRLRDALRSCGCSARGMTQEQARLMLAEAMCSYGHRDPDEAWDNYRSYHTEIVVMNDDPMEFDGWKADKRLTNTTLEAYVKSQHLNY